MITTSQDLFAQAQQFIVGGVNSPVRAFTSVDSQPVFIDRGEGAYLYDVEGKRYLDYVGSWGPLILGHAHPQVVAAICETAAKGSSFGAPTQLEIDLAAKVCELMPSIERIRMVNSGTEAAMTAIRLARGFTGKNKIVKFIGCYHGHYDPLLVKAGSGGLTLGLPDSKGVTPALAADTLLADYNNLDQVAQLFEDFANEIAAIIVEPVAGNMNCVLPVPGFLQGLRELCHTHNSLLIFDEVMTGFRVALGGAQQRFNIKPDLTMLGKVIGGGLPVAAVGGKKEIMEFLAPLGPVYQAGTLSGNPLAMAAGLTTLNLISETGFYNDLENNTRTLTEGIQQLAQQHKVALQTTQIGGMFGLFFTSTENLTNLRQVQTCNLNRFKQFFNLMLQNGIYLAPSAYEVGFVSSAHSSDDINTTLTSIDQIFKQLA